MLFTSNPPSLKHWSRYKTTQTLFWNMYWIMKVMHHGDSTMALGMRCLYFKYWATLDQYSPLCSQCQRIRRLINLLVWFSICLWICLWTIKQNFITLCWSKSLRVCLIFNTSRLVFRVDKVPTAHSLPPLQPLLMIQLLLQIISRSLNCTKILMVLPL